MNNKWFPVTRSLLICGLLILFYQPISGQSSFTGKVKIYRFSLKGLSRSFLLFDPGNKPNKEPLPLLIFIHGGGGNARSSIRLTEGRFNQLASRDGFLVAYAQAVQKSWNDGRTGDFSEAIRDNIDDVSYFMQLISLVKNNYLLDTTRIFCCGISNGGFMTARLACELGNVIKAVAIVSATMAEDLVPQCKAHNPVKLLLMNGTEDPLVPYNGGYVSVFNKKRGRIISTDSMIQYWCNVDHCAGSPSISNLEDKDTLDGTHVEKSVYKDVKGKPTVVLFKIWGGGHSWPGGHEFFPGKLVGKTCRDINACDEIWKFLKE